jgi:hypothetical protein
LKEEIRRQERNQQRSEASNLEYLKNVVLKFIECADEQTQLIPVLGMLLHFSPEELKRITVCNISDIFVVSIINPHSRRTMPLGLNRNIRRQQHSMALRHIYHAGPESFC